MENTDETASDTWLTVEEAAVLLRRKPRAVHTYAEGGRLTVRRVGRRNLFARTEVDVLATELHAADVLADRLAVVPDAPMSDTLTPQMAALQGEIAVLRHEIADLRSGMVTMVRLHHETQQDSIAIRAELAHQGAWPRMNDIAADYVTVSAERDSLRDAYDARSRWWVVAGASMMMVGMQLLFVIALIALGVIQRV